MTNELSHVSMLTIAKSQQARINITLVFLSESMLHCDNKHCCISSLCAPYPRVH